MMVSLCKLGLFRMKMGRENRPQQYVEKNLNRLDEAFDFMCNHISRYLFFHLEGLRTLNEAWDKIKYLFGKQDELRGNILENEIIALHPRCFESILQLFIKYKSLVL